MGSPPNASSTFWVVGAGIHTGTHDDEEHLSEGGATPSTARTKVSARLPLGQGPPESVRYQLRGTRFSPPRTSTRVLVRGGLNRVPRS